MNLETLKFPIGHYNSNKDPGNDLVNKWIETISEFPEKVENSIKKVSKEQLNYKYRPGGWTVKQVIHHCADSHMNCLLRFKWTLTENKPTIKPYFEDRWANLPDYQTDDLSDTLTLLKGVHKKLTTILRSLNKDQLLLEFQHPEYAKTYNLAETIGNYAWHCDHHFAHVKNGLNSNGKYNN